MNSDFSSLIHNLILDSTVPAKDLAKAIGKPYSTLLREVNPYDPGAKIGAETLLQVMTYTGNITPLEFMADSLGFKVIAGKKEVPYVTPGAFQGTTQAQPHYDLNTAPDAADVTKRA